MKIISKYLIALIFIVTLGFALEPIKTNLEYLPKLRGDEVIPCTRYVPYYGGRQSPGDIIGTTSYEYQNDGNNGQRLVVDEFGQAHIDWMWCDYPNQDDRYCAWNARYADGSYYGEIQASPSWSGFVQIDITNDGRTVIAYHYNAGAGYYSWIDIDAGNLSGAFMSDPKSIEVADYLWPTMCVANNNNILLGAHDHNSINHQLFLSTDMGNSWSSIAVIDSNASYSFFVRSSRNPGSSKVVYIWEQSMDLSTASPSQWCNDVWYQLSTDNGITWSAPINITNYTPPDSISAGDSAIWAFNTAIAAFDRDDNLHIAWGGHLAWRGAGDTLYGGDRAKIFHWSEATGTISTVSSPSTYYTEPNGFWLEPWSAGEPYWDAGAAGSWRTICDHPQLVVDTITNDLYCLWLGNDDSTDVALNTYINGEIYGAYSTDNGITWSEYINLTNTRSPGAPAGACMDEDYMTANPYLVNDSIYLTYIEDKDACAFVHAGAMTENPVHCWVFNKNLITGIVESTSESTSAMVLELFPNPASRFSTIFYTIPESNNISLKLYSIDGRLVQVLDTGYKMTGAYKFILDLRNLANGTYFLILDTMSERITNSIIIVH